jgi:bacterioferritin
LAATRRSGSGRCSRRWHDIGDILRESLEHESEGLVAYSRLLDIAERRSVLLEEYARRMISDETRHVGEVEKMLRPPGMPPSSAPP